MVGFFPPPEHEFFIYSNLVETCFYRCNACQYRTQYFLKEKNAALGGITVLLQGCTVAKIIMNRGGEFSVVS